MIKKIIKLPLLFVSFIFISLPGCFNSTRTARFTSNKCAEKPNIIPKKEVKKISSPKIEQKKLNKKIKPTFEKKDVVKIITPAVKKESVQKSKEEPKKVHLEPVSTQPLITDKPVTLSALQTVEDEAHELFKRCVDKEDKTLSWIDFANQISAILKRDQKYSGLAQAFADISTSNSITYITYKLWWYTDKMPPKTHALYKQFTKSQLIELINMRIALNKK